MNCHVISAAVHLPAAGWRRHGWTVITQTFWLSGFSAFVFELADSKGTPGTNSAAEAAKILAENRRLMREQKEKEEQLRVQREEEEK